MQKKLKINKQNFQGEITSGFIVKLEKLTQENIRLGKQQQKERGKNDNIQRLKNCSSN
jgi:L-lysine 2,3-aminomutase